MTPSHPETKHPADPSCLNPKMSLSFTQL
jgi:hypothetical protein